MKRLLAVLALAGVVLAGGAGAAYADTVTVRKVDTTKFPRVTLSALVAGKTPAVTDFHIRENGRIIDKFDVLPIGKTNIPVGIVLAVDVSGSMNQNGKLDAAKAAARQFVSQKLANDQIAIVAFSSQPRVVVNFTNDAALLGKAIDGLTANGETALWDGVRTAVGLFNDRPDLQPNVVILSDGKDTVSTNSSAQAQAAAVTAHAAVFAVGLEGGDFDGAPLKSIADATGGQFEATADPKTLSGLYASVQRSLQNQYEISYQSTANGPLSIELSVAGVQATANATAGGVSQGVNTKPTIVKPAPGPSFLKGTAGKWIVIGLAVVAAGLLAFGIGLLTTREEGTLRSTLQPYDAEGTEAAEDGEHDRSFVDSAFVQRAVDATGRLAEERGVLQRVEQMLEQADLPLRAAEALFFYLAAVIILTLIGVFLTRSPIGALIVLIVAALVPPAILSFLAGRRRRAFTSQLPDTLQLLAGSLRAGYSLLQGVETVAQEVDDPMGKELRRVMAEARLGRVMEDALDDSAARLQSPDFEWAVMAVRVQREVGGNLAELLSTVSETMIARERLRREVRALTAEGRMSAIILGALPVGLGLLMYSINPDYMHPLFTTGIGQAMLAGGIVLGLAGFYWMKKMIEIDI